MSFFTPIRVYIFVSNRLFEAVPFYNGITLEEIGGRGVRWVDREAFESPAWEPVKLDVPSGLPDLAPGLRLVA